MARSSDPSDPSGLIAEAYRIEGISPVECRSIFFDWAIGLKSDTGPALADLLARYGMAQPTHPMTQVLCEGQEGVAAPAGRRGGRKTR